MTKIYIYFVCFVPRLFREFEEFFHGFCSFVDMNKFTVFSTPLAIFSVYLHHTSCVFYVMNSPGI